MRRLWKKLTHLGVREDDHPLDVKTIRISNRLVLIGIAVMMAYGISILIAMFVFNLEVPRIHYPLIANIVSCAVLVGVLYLAHLGYREISKFFGLLLGNLIMLSFVILSGHHIGVQKYFYLAAILPFFVYSWTEKYKVIPLVAFSIALYTFQEWWLLSHDAVVTFESTYKKFFLYLSNTGFLAMLMASAFYLYKETHAADMIIEEERQKSDSLLHSILPHKYARQLIEDGQVLAEHFDSVSVLFTDFAGFTRVASKMTPGQLVDELDYCFSRFDDYAGEYGLEKLKTIGDGYMCAGGLPEKNNTHAIDCALMGLRIIDFMSEFKRSRRANKLPYWQVRVGIHSGPVMAGVIGKRKFNFDVWGDTVNVASRMESNGTNGRINISGDTYQQLKPLFKCQYRGNRMVKNKGRVRMYYVTRLLHEYSADKRGLRPNESFFEEYERLKSAN